MAEYSSVLNEIIKAKENIKRKFNLLKNDEADTQSLVEHTFKPLIEPLTEISQKTEKYSTFKPKIEKEYSKVPIEEGDSIIENSLSIDQKPNNETKFKNWFESNERDKIYGPSKIIDRDHILLGNKEIEFNEENILSFDDQSYTLTHGLEQLLFSKNPKLYTRQDLKSYKQILIQTSAHLTADGSRIRKGGTKYETIIEKFFLTGEGMKYGGLKLQKYNLVYWNDPNELIDRLRLLLASQAAGNTSVSNEILSIFEELYEAGIIKRIPNV
jgi:hypothetical protein